jgi:hypothetical protein
VEYRLRRYNLAKHLENFDMTNAFDDRHSRWIMVYAKEHRLTEFLWCLRNEPFSQGLQGLA